MKSISAPLLIAAAGLLAACGGSDEEEKEKIDYASFDDAAVKQLADEGQYQKALEIIKAQDEMEISTKADFLTATDIYLGLMDGVAAEVAIEKARDAGATKGEVALKLASALMIQTKYDEAQNVLEHSEFEGEEKFRALLLQGDLAQQNDEGENATKYYEAAIELKPDDFRGHLGLALLSLNAGRLDQAKQYARYQGRSADAEKHLLKAVELHQRNLLAYFELIGLYIENNELEKAQQQLDAVYALDDDNPMAQYYSALILATEGNLKEAEYMLLRTGDFTRSFPPAARIYGHVAFQLGKYSAAQPYLERSLQRAPADRPTRLMLAECLTRRGQGAKALLYLEPLILIQKNMEHLD